MARAKAKQEEGRVLPSLVEVEDCIIGILMMYEGAIKRLPIEFKPCVFYRDSNQRIAESILYLTNNNIHPDILNIQIELKKRNILEDVGGAYHLSQLASKIDSSSMLEHKYVAVVEQYLRREFIRITHEYSEQGYDNSVDVFEMIERVSNDIKDIDSFLTRAYSEKYDDVIANTIDNICKVSDVNYTETFKTGDIEFDSKVGFFPESLMILSGESGSGKYIVYLKNYIIFAA
jgi:replicative DNA helicase